MVYATAVLMAATVLQVAINWFKNRKIEKMHIAVLVLAMVFGGATIYFQDKAYLIWKVTIVNWLFAVVFFASHFIGHSQKQLIYPNSSGTDSVICGSPFSLYSVRLISSLQKMLILIPG